MANKLNTISEEVFKILKGNGYRLQLFTIDGTKTVDPAEAARFYISDQRTMITVMDSEEKEQIEVNISQGTAIETIQSMIDSLRALATRHMIGYTLRTFGKDIHPRDFAYQAKREKNMDTVQEGFSRTYGSRKSSYQTLENAKLVIRHKKAVDEEVRGSRSRNIHSLFIENAEGERFRFPNNNLLAARALTRHVTEGGNPYDVVGKHIISLSEELAQLRKFTGYVTKNSLLGEDTNDVFEGVKTRIQNIRENFKTLCSTRGYQQYASQVEESENVIAQEEISNVRDRFTVQMFDETVADALPHVARIVNEISSKEKMLARFNALTNKVNDKSTFEVQGDFEDTDPDNPSNMSFSSGIEELAAWAGYLAKFIKDDELSNMVSDLGGDIPDLPQKNQVMAAKLLTKIRDNAILDQIESEKNKHNSVVSESMKYITGSFRRLGDISKIL